MCPQLKLEDYKKRLTWGEELNHDQMVSPGYELAPKAYYLLFLSGVCALAFFLKCIIFEAAAEKYEEVLHHLAFAQELHKTLDELTQNVSLWQSDYHSLLISVWVLDGIEWHVKDCLKPVLCFAQRMRTYWNLKFAH